MALKEQNTTCYAIANACHCPMPMHAIVHAVAHAVALAIAHAILPMLLPMPLPMPADYAVAEKYERNAA